MAITVRSSNGIVEYFLASTNTSHTANISDAAVGDLRVISINMSPDGTGTVPSDPTITGWTSLHASIATGAASNGRLSSFYRVVQSGDTLTSATLGFTTDQTCMIGSVSTTFEGVDTGTVFDQTSPTPTTGTHPITTPGITTQTAGAVVVSCGIQDGTTGAIDDTDVPTSYTVLGTMNNNPPSNGMNLGTAYRTIASPTSTGTLTWQTNTGSEETAGATYALRPVTASWEQEGFRWREDDGNESGASWLDAQDTDISRATGANTRLRVLANATGNPATGQVKIQYKRDDEAASEWRDV